MACADAFVKLNSFASTQCSFDHISAPVLQESQLRPIRVKNGREPGDLTGGEKLNPLQTLLFGALSGASAEAVVYPMEVIRRRMQVQAASASTAGQSLVSHLCSCLELGKTACIELSWCPACVPCMLCPCKELCGACTPVLLETNAC